MSEKIGGKQDRPSLIIEPPPPPQIKIYKFWPIYEKLHGFQLLSLVVHNYYVSTVMRSAFADILVSPLTLDFLYGPNMTPKTIFLYIFLIQLKRFLSDCFPYLTCKLMKTRVLGRP